MLGRGELRENQPCLCLLAWRRLRCSAVGEEKWGRRPVALQQNVGMPGARQSGG